MQDVIMDFCCRLLQLYPSTIGINEMTKLSGSIGKAARSYNREQMVVKVTYCDDLLLWVSQSHMRSPRQITKNCMKIARFEFRMGCFARIKDEIPITEQELFCLMEKAYPMAKERVFRIGNFKFVPSILEDMGRMLLFTKIQKHLDGVHSLHCHYAPHAYFHCVTEFIEAQCRGGTLRYLHMDPWMTFFPNYYGLVYAMFSSPEANIFQSNDVRSVDRNEYFLNLIAIWMNNPCSGWPPRNRRLVGRIIPPSLSSAFFWTECTDPKSLPVLEEAKEWKWILRGEDVNWGEGADHFYISFSPYYDTTNQFMVLQIVHESAICPLPFDSRLLCHGFILHMFY